MQYNIEVKGIDELVAKLGRATAQEVIDEPMRLGALSLIRWIKQERFKGPRGSDILKTDRGNLSRSIALHKSINSNEFTYFIGTNIEYGRIHEFGFVGMVQVKDHIRRLRRTVSFKRGDKRLRRTISGGYQHVKAHGRFMNMPARPFLRPAIENEDNVKSLVDRITTSINKALSA